MRRPGVTTFSLDGKVVLAKVGATGLDSLQETELALNVVPGGLAVDEDGSRLLLSATSQTLIVTRVAAADGTVLSTETVGSSGMRAATQRAHGRVRWWRTRSSVGTSASSWTVSGAPSGARLRCSVLG